MESIFSSYWNRDDSRVGVQIQLVLPTSFNFFNFLFRTSCTHFLDLLVVFSNRKIYSTFQAIGRPYQIIAVLMFTVLLTGHLINKGNTRFRSSIGPCMAEPL